MNTLPEIWDYLLYNAVATEEELQLVTSINGYTEDTLNDVLYVRTGYRNINQEEDEDEEE
jgi:hypothetical protein